MNVIDLAKLEHKHESHVQPATLRQIPAIDDDGFALFESRAICRYLSAKSDNQLTPSQPQAARADGSVAQCRAVELLTAAR